MRLAFGSSLCVSVIVLACARPAQMTSSPEEFRRAVSGAEWQLTDLDGQPAPTGAGGRRATLRFEPDSARAAGRRSVHARVRG
jgi:hypothetical protein